MGNRGFRAGNLGDPASPQNYTASELGTYDDSEGGLRRWEASIELRIPLSDEVESALFLDAGDVNRLPQFRFDYLHLTFGMGVRYQTIVGPIRLDAGYLIPGAQVIGETYPESTGTTFWDRVRLHLTIGEAF